MKTLEIERRFLPEPDSEIRLLDDGGKKKIAGYAAVFGKRSENFWSEEDPFFEVIEPGAFAGADMRDVVALFDHGGLPLARTSSKTLILNEDERGLKYEFEPAASGVAKDIISALERRDIQHSSFAFTVRKGGQKIIEDGGETVRYITAVDRLYDVSLVTRPAYPDTSVTLRVGEDFISEQTKQTTAEESNNRRQELFRLRERLELKTKE